MGALLEAQVRETETAGIEAVNWGWICRALIAAIVLCLAIDATFDRTFTKNLADGSAYLDVSNAIAHGNAKALLNTYWSPGYPVALYLGLRLLHPSPARELAAVYAINCVVLSISYGGCGRDGVRASVSG